MTGGKPRAMLIDLDGTLALLGDRDPYDGEACSTDQPCEACTMIVQAVSLLEPSIGFKRIIPLYLTGRNEKARKASLQWLDQNDMPSGPLFMRDPSDWRKAEIFKREAYETKIEPYYEIVFVLEDYDPCVKMWRELGLTVLQPRVTEKYG